jgi:hypothetical protein
VRRVKAVESGFGLADRFSACLGQIGQRWRMPETGNLESQTTPNLFVLPIQHCV